MIKFFRKIRQSLLAEGKTTQYIKYAIGEIVLVMVGILLALQVSNWNQERIARNKEKVLLTELNLEFKENKAQLEEVLIKHRKALKSTDLLIAEFPLNLDSINLDSLKEKSKGLGYRYTFNPSQGIVNSLVSTSSFELISDLELRKLLVGWSDVLADYQEEERNAVRLVNDHITPFRVTHFPIWSLKDARVNPTAAETREFESWVYVRRGSLLDILGTDEYQPELTRIQACIDRIIELSEPPAE